MAFDVNLVDKIHVDDLSIKTDVPLTAVSNYEESRFSDCFRVLHENFEEQDEFGRSTGNYASLSPPLVQTLEDEDLENLCWEVMIVDEVINKNNLHSVYVMRLDNYGKLTLFYANATHVNSLLEDYIDAENLEYREVFNEIGEVFSIDTDIKAQEVALDYTNIRQSSIDRLYTYVLKKLYPPLKYRNIKTGDVHYLDIVTDDYEDLSLIRTLDRIGKYLSTFLEELVFLKLQCGTIINCPKSGNEYTVYDTIEFRIMKTDDELFEDLYFHPGGAEDDPTKIINGSDLIEGPLLKTLKGEGHYNHLTNNIIRKMPIKLERSYTPLQSKYKAIQDISNQHVIRYLEKNLGLYNHLEILNQIIRDNKRLKSI